MQTRKRADQASCDDSPPKKLAKECKDVLKTKVTWSSDPDQPVSITIGEAGISSAEPITIGQMFQQAKEQYPNHPALCFKGEDAWNKLSYLAYYNLCIRAAKSFLKLGLTPRHGVSIIGFNSKEWFTASLGCVFAGGLSCGIYTTNSAETCHYICEDCKANVAVVEDDAQLQKFLKIRDSLPHLKAIVQYKGTVSEQYSNVYEWKEFLQLGDDTEDKVVEDIISSQKPEDCACLIYTSGTTGVPKGVMITHDNITWTSKCFAQTYGCFLPGTETIISYLPLSHIAAQMLDMYLQIHVGGTTYFAQPDALKGSLAQTLNEVNPSIFFGVPRVWEKFYDKLKELVPTGTSQQAPSEEMKKAIEQKVRAALGFSKLKLAVCAAAPVQPQILSFFDRLGIKIQECWGQSEGCGPGTTSTTYKENGWKVGTVGKAFDGVEVKVTDADPLSGVGEVCFRGRNVMMGYLNQPEKTKEVMDDHGWVHSGDLGKFDEDGFLLITGRKKELIVTSGGEKVAPVPIEEKIKKLVPFLSNVMCVGDNHNYITCLVTLKCIMNPVTGLPSDELDPAAIESMKALGSTATSVSQVIQMKDKQVYDAIQKTLDEVNEEALSNVAKVKKFMLLPQDFSIPGGELGPTLKLKRFYVTSKYSQEVGSLYSPAEQSTPSEQ